MPGRGIPASIYGFSREVAYAFWAKIELDQSDVGGMGGTLARNALSITAMRASLEHVLTPVIYDRCDKVADRYEAGIKEAINEFDLPWIVTRLGLRVEYCFRQTRPRNGGEANAAMDGELDRYMHL